MKFSKRQLCSIAVCIICLGHGASAQECQYNSFTDALPSGIFGSTSLFKAALSISGYEDKLPSPNSGIPLTFAIPSNKAVLSLLWKNGFFIPSLSSIGSALPATILYNVVLGAISPEQMQGYTSSSPGTAPSAYGLLSGKSEYNLNYYSDVVNGDTRYYFQPTINGGLAGAGEPISVCGSFIYITDELLVPSSDEKIKGVQGVTIPDNLPWSNSNSGGTAGGGGDAVVASQAGPPPPAAPAVPPTPQIPECIMPSGTQPGVVALPPPLPTPISATPEQPPCNTTYADAAKAAGLTILSGALGQPGISSRLPDPSQPATLLAPVDTAFLNMLTTLNISIDQALSLGDKLASVILYHVHPDEALSIEEVRIKPFLTTALGQGYDVGVDTSLGPNTPLRLYGRPQGNVATVTKELKVCAASVLVVDNVLLLTESLDQLPEPGPVTSSTTPFPGSNSTEPALPSEPDGAVAAPPTPEDPSLPVIVGDDGEPPSSQTPLLSAAQGLETEASSAVSLKAGILDNGLASGVGKFANCVIQLTAAGSTLKTTSDASGRFSFPGIPDCATDTGVVTLPSGLDQLGTCVDTSSGMPPPYSLSALLSNLLGVNGTITNSTNDIPFNLSPLTTLVSDAIMSGSNSNGNASNALLGQSLSAITQEVVSALGLDPALDSSVLVDAINSLLNVASNDPSSVVSNAQTLISDVIGGNTLIQLFPGLDLNQAVKAINSAIATGGANNLLTLDDPNVMQNVLQTAFNSLSSIFTKSGNDGGGGESGLLGGRKLRQTPPQQSQNSTAVLQAIAQPMAQLNQLAKEGANATDQGQGTASVYNATEMFGMISNCARVAQYNVAPAARDLAAGNIGIPDFASSYSPQQIRIAVQGNDSFSETSGTVEPLGTTLAPAPASSRGSMSYSIPGAAAGAAAAATMAVLIL